MIFYENNLPFKSVDLCKEDTLPLPVTDDDSNMPDVVDVTDGGEPFDDQSAACPLSPISNEIVERMGTDASKFFQRHGNRRRRPPCWMED